MKAQFSDAYVRRQASCVKMSWQQIEGQVLILNLFDSKKVIPYKTYFSIHTN